MIFYISMLYHKVLRVDAAERRPRRREEGAARAAAVLQAGLPEDERLAFEINLVVVRHLQAEPPGVPVAALAQGPGFLDR